MKLSDLRKAIDAAIALWGDRPITTREMFFSDRGPREAEIRIQEAEVGILASFSGGLPTKWATLDAMEPPSPLAPATREWMNNQGKGP
jgi:hypothetical protein